MTQEELARRAGMSLKGMGDIERGVIPDPHYSSLNKIAEGLGMSVGELLEEPVLSGKAEAPRAAGPTDEGATGAASSPGSESDKQKAGDPADRVEVSIEVLGGLAEFAELVAEKRRRDPDLILNMQARLFEQYNGCLEHLARPEVLRLTTPDQKARIEEQKKRIEEGLSDLAVLGAHKHLPEHPGDFSYPPVVPPPPAQREAPGEETA